MVDLISIGSVSIDLYFKGDSLTQDKQRFHLAIGGKYSVDFFHLDVGGGGLNVAVGCSKLNLNTALLSTIGENIFKKLILEKLKKYHVSYKFCDFVPNYYNISTILLSKNGERSIVHYATFGQKLFDHQIKISSLKNTKIVYLGNLPDVSLEEKKRVINYAKKNNILTILNLGTTDCQKPRNELINLLENIDILIINGHEFAQLVKAKYNDIFFNENVILHYIPVLKNKIVIITEGKKGSFGYHLNKIYHIPAKEIKEIIDTTGAGDGYTAGFIATYYQTQDIQKSMIKATDYASRILQKIGAN